jgi:hypothetical protein
MLATTRQRRIFLWVSLSSIVTFVAMGTWADTLEAASVMIRAANGVVLTPSTAFAETDVSISNLTLDPITFGHVDPTTGAVVNSQFLVYMALELGTAPLRGLSGFIYDLQGNLAVPFNLDASTPQFSTVFAFDSLLTLPPNGVALLVNFRAVPHLEASVGAEGDITLRVALLESPTNPSKKLKKAPGVTLPIRYLIRDQLFCCDLRGGAFLAIGGAD